MHTPLQACFGLSLKDSIAQAENLASPAGVTESEARNNFRDQPRDAIFNGSANSRRAPPRHLFRVKGAPAKSFDWALGERDLRWDSRWDEPKFLCNSGHHRSWRTGCMSSPPTRRCSPSHRHRHINRKMFPWRRSRDRPQKAGSFHKNTSLDRPQSEVENDFCGRSRDVFMVARRRYPWPQRLHLLAIRSREHGA